MIDPLLEQDPWIQELRAKYQEEGRQEGIAEGELRSLRNMLISAVKLRFPSLASIAEARALHIGQPGVLNVLIQRIFLASDEQAARAALDDRMSQT